MKQKKLILLCLIFCSCAQLRRSAPTSPQKNVYRFTDQSGDYLLERESGISAKKKNIHVMKGRLLGQKGDKQEVFEQNILMSQSGIRKKDKEKIYRPKESKTTVYFEGKPHTSRFIVDAPNLELSVVSTSPDNFEGKRETFSLKDLNDGPLCFFQEVIECLKRSPNWSQIRKGIEINLTVLWNGYPYFSEQYVGVPQEPFSQATFLYEGKNPAGNLEFALNVGDQKIFYHLNQKFEFEKLFWVAQGMTMEKSKGDSSTPILENSLEFTEEEPAQPEKE